MSRFLIRRARKEDLSRIQEVARRTIDESYRSFLGDEAVDSFIDSGASDSELQNHIDNCDVLLADDAIVAFTIYFEDLIHLMMVDVALHRTGLGSRLLAHSERRLFSAGNTRIRLETFDGNQQAIGFYEKNGWSIVSKQEDEEQGFTRVYLEKEA